MFMIIWNRRIGRLGFVLFSLPLYAIVFSLVLTAEHHVWVVNGDPKRFVLWLVLVLWSIMVTAWRCHDFNESLWSNFWTDQVPIIGPFVALWDLLAKPGTPGYNSYGPEPSL